MNADFEAGFAETAEGVGVNVTRCIETGVAGLSIEDRDGQALYPMDVAVERLRAARAAIDRSGEDSAPAASAGEAAAIVQWTFEHSLGAWRI